MRFFWITMSERIIFVILATMSRTTASISMSNNQPKFTIKAERNKAFDKSCLIGTFKIQGEKIADCLEHCLESCQCQSFQTCRNTECQLCSSHSEENGSLLHDQDGCVYAMYQMHHLTETFQKLNDQCSDMSCYMKYNCCQQSGLCPKNQICKPINSPENPWKRFTCECPDGYHRNNCNQPITSCQGYASESPKSGLYKVLDSNNLVHEVYCHFDSDGAWTLVQSYSSANGSKSNNIFIELTRPLSESHPVSENVLTWSGHRLSKQRMKSIKDNSSFLQFTCDYEKRRDINASDYVQICLETINSVDVLELDGSTSKFTVGHGRGKIGNFRLDECEIQLHQSDVSNYNKRNLLHARINHGIPKCAFDGACQNSSHEIYFRSSRHPDNLCVRDEVQHRCVLDAQSTTQIWFGTRRSET